MIRPSDLPDLDPEGMEVYDLGYDTASKLWTDRGCVDLDAVVLAALPGCREDDPGFLAVAGGIIDGARDFYAGRLTNGTDD